LITNRSSRMINPLKRKLEAQIALINY